MADESLVNGGSGGRAQRRKVRKDGWTKPRRKTFVATLVATCNVRSSAERAGMSATSAYALRHRDPGFARLWDEALAMGYDQLEALLLQRAIEGLNDIDVAALIGGGTDGGADADDAPDGGATVPGVRAVLTRADVQLGLDMLKRRGAKDGLRARGRKPMSSDEVDAMLVRKLDALARRRAQT